MREAHTSHEIVSDERPIGRFLNSLRNDDAQFETTYEDALDFTRQFRTLYGRHFHRRGISAIARTRLDEDNQITMATPQEAMEYRDSIWIEFDHRESPSGHERHIWRLVGGLEQYDLELRENYWLATYYEKSNMNLILRRYPIYDEQHVQGLFHLIETAITNPQNLDQLDDIDERIDTEREELSRLEQSGERPSPRQTKRMDELRRHLGRSGFESGGVDRSQSRPLL